jgi:hypothetical protein
VGVSTDAAKPVVTNVLMIPDKIGATPLASTSKEFEAFTHTEVTKWGPVLKAENIRAQ